MLINISFLTVSLAAPSSGELYHVAYSARRGGRTYRTSRLLNCISQLEASGATLFVCVRKSRVIYSTCNESILTNTLRAYGTLLNVDKMKYSIGFDQ